MREKNHYQFHLKEKKLEEIKLIFLIEDTIILEIKAKELLNEKIIIK